MYIFFSVWLLNIVVSFIAKKINEQNSETVLLTSQRIVQLLSVGTCYYGCVGWVVVENIFQLKTVQLRINKNVYMLKNVNKPRILQVRGIVTA